MRLESCQWTVAGGWRPAQPGRLGKAPLVLVFGSPAALEAVAPLAALRAAYPAAVLAGCSTAGEIAGPCAVDGLVSTAVEFQHTRVGSVAVPVTEAMGSFGAGEKIGRELAADNLAHVLLFLDGTSINCCDLIRGLDDCLAGGAAVTGGLAGDGLAFQAPRVLVADAPRGGLAVAVGLYGARLKVGWGAGNGWDPFGAERVVTRANGHTLYELDHKPAWDAWREYLGPTAAEGVAGAWRLPLWLRVPGAERRLARTPLAVHADGQGMDFGGDVPMGAYGRFMKANVSRLVRAAGAAAGTAAAPMDLGAPGLALVVSCASRKLFLGPRVDEELAAVASVLGPAFVSAGFYAYGALEPTGPRAHGEIQNQTLVVTTLQEN